MVLSSFKPAICSCAPPKKIEVRRELEYRNSDCVFIGDVFEIDTVSHTYKIKVIESFDGDKVGKVYNGENIDNCSIYIDSKGKWLIYALQNENHIININGCGLTRSFKSPENGYATIPPPPPPPEGRLSDKVLEKISKKYYSVSKKKAQIQLKEEIALLRTKTTN